MLRISHHDLDLLKVDTKQNLTPWQKVYAKFGMSPSQLARALGRHRSKLSRALKDKKGLISGRDQELIFKVARELQVPITAQDVTPAAHD